MNKCEVCGTTQVSEFEYRHDTICYQCGLNRPHSREETQIEKTIREHSAPVNQEDKNGIQRH